MAMETRPEWKRSKTFIGINFNQELADEICKRMENCENLRDICKDEHMPRIKAITRWRNENPTFNEAFLKSYRLGIKKAEESRVPNKHRNAGRPSIRTPQIIEEIIARMEDGELLPEICKSSYMPRPATVYEWAYKDQELATRIARARVIGAEQIQAYCLDIADDGSNDYYEKEGRNGQTFIALNQENIQRSRLRIDTRKWLVGAIDPRFKEGPQVKLSINTPELGSINIDTTGGHETEDPQKALEEFQKLVKGE